MTTAYTPILGLALPVTGELQGTWGQTVNDEITSLTESAIAGTTQLTSDADVTLSTTDGSANQARQVILRCTGARSSLKTIVAPARSKTYFVINATSGGFGVNIAGPGPTTGVTVAPGKSTWVAWSGSDFVEIAPAVATNLSAGTTGAIPYQTGANATTFLGIGTAAQVLQVNSGATAPEWVNTSGTGDVARTTSPSFTTPSLGAATALSINSLTLTTSTGTFTLANGKTLTVNNSLTLSGTDATTMTFPSTSATIARTDAAQTFTGTQTVQAAATQDAVALAGRAGGTSSYVSTLTPTTLSASRTVTLPDADTTVPVATQVLTFTGPTAGRTITLPNANFTVARSDAAQSFTGTQTFLSNPVLDAGTANGVLYLNGSKVVTSGSALTFDGTNFRNTSGAFEGIDNMTLSALVSSTNATVLTLNSAGTSGTTRFQINGSEQMRLDSTGLGIGTSSPSNKLTVSGSAAFSGIGFNANAIDTVSTAQSFARFQTTGGDFYIGTEGSVGGVFFPGSTAYAAVLYNASSTPMQFYTAGTLRATLDSSGNLGIGTSSPTARVHAYSGTAMAQITADGLGAIKTGINFANGGTTYGQIYFDNNSPYDMSVMQQYITGSLRFGTNNTEQMRLDSSGNLGLGVTPSAWTSYKALQVASTGGALSSSSSSDLEITTNAYYNAGWLSQGAGVDSSRYRLNAGTHAWFTAPSEPAGDPISFTQAMTLDASGNLLVGGTSVYAATMTSYASASRSAGLGFRNSAGTTAGGIFTAAAGSGGGSTDVFVEAAGYLGFNAGGTTERMRLDSSGNLGLGVTPSAWGSSARAFTVKSTGSSIEGSLCNTGADNATAIANNAYYNAGWKYVWSGGSYGATRYDLENGQHRWFTAASGTAGDPISFSQAMTLDGSGNLALGATSANARLDVVGGSIRVNEDSIGTKIITVRSDYAGLGPAINVTTSHPLLFLTGNTERMRLDTSGNLGLGVTPSASWTGGANLQIGLGAVYANSSLGACDVSYNSVRTASNSYVYAQTGLNATRLQQRDGAFNFFTAPSGTAGNPISFTQAMTLDASGNLGVGTTSPGSKLNVVGTTAGIGYLAGIVLSDNATTTVSLGLQTPGGSDLPFVYGNSGLGFGTNSAERARIDSSGNLGLGVTPSAWSGSGVKAFDVGTGASFAGSGSDAGMIANAYYNGSNWIYKTSSLAVRYQQLIGTGAHAWYTAPSGTAGDPISFTQAMTLTANGNLLVGATALPSASVEGICFTGTTSGNFSSSGASTAAYNHLLFYNGNGIVGSISTTGSATTYSTSSDYRLKNITGPITTSGAYIDSLNPVEGTWKADGSTFVGLIAHEVQEASRTTVATGVKDGEEMQGMDYSSAEIIANLIAEVKSLRQRLTAAGI